MHERFIDRLSINTIDRAGIVTSCSRLFDSIAAEGVQIEDVIGSSAWGIDQPYGSIVSEDRLGPVAAALLERRTTRFTTQMQTPRGKVITSSGIITPSPEGAVAVCWEEHDGPLLSEVERQVVAGVGDGLTHGEIGERLGLSASSSKRYLESARIKLRARNGCHAVSIALRRGLI